MAKNYTVNDTAKIIYADMKNLTADEEKAIQMMIAGGYKLSPKKKMSEATKAKMVSPKQIYEFIKANKGTYGKVLDAWETAKKELITYIDKKTKETKTRKGGDMNARKTIKEKFPAEYADIMNAIKAERA